MFIISVIYIITFTLFDSEVVSLDRYCSDRGITLVPAFDIEDTVTSGQVISLSGVISATLTHFPSAR